MCVSEYDLPIEKGGVESKIIDYSISNPGPSPITKTALKKAVERGHKPYAKIQINNSWECSAAPYLPVFDLTFEHLQNLSKIGVYDYMMTWTLGGYPSPVIDLVADFTAKKQAFDLDKWYGPSFPTNVSNGDLIYTLNPERVFPKNWLNSDVPVFFDFCAQNIEHNLFCLMPGRVGGKAAIYITSKTKFLAQLKAGKVFDADPKEYVKVLCEELEKLEKLKRRTISNRGPIRRSRRF
jgi:hypothetical protein